MYIQLKLNFSQNIILYNFTIWNNYSRSDLPCRQSFLILSQSELRLPLLQVVSNNKYFSVGVQSPTEINAPRGCAVILKRRCQLALTRITHQVSRAFDLNLQPDHRHIFHNQLVALPAYHKAIIHDRFAFCFPIASFSPNILLFKINA